MELLTVSGLEKTYSSGKKETRAVRGVSFSASQGEIVGILGPNGSGKTTTLKSILSLIEYDKGRILFEGKDTRKHKRFLLKHSAAVLEGARNIYWRLTPNENMDYMAGIRELPARGRKELKESILDSLDLTPMAKKEVGQLSRGFQQRSAIASALFTEPKLLLLDEPTLGLDIESVRKMRDVLLSPQRKKRLTLVSSHDMRFIESVCDRIILFKEGRIIKEGSVADFRSVMPDKSISLSLEKPLSEKLRSLLEARPDIRIQNKNSFILITDDDAPLHSLMALLKEEDAAISDIKYDHNDLEAIFLQLVSQRSES